MKSVWIPAALGVFAIMLTNGHAADRETIEAATSSVEQQVINWRRDIHQHPELGNEEYRTAKLVAKHLKSLGMDVQTGVAKTGVVGILRGGKSGPVVALRADMDALPIEEATGLSFASKAKGKYAGETVSVMHACGHDAHTAILMGAASVLAGMQDDLAGTVMFIFQPAEEGAPPGETGGASRMLAEGVFDELKPEAMFALHVEPGPVGLIDIRPKGILAGATGIDISLTGTGAHAAKPWQGTDLIELSADIVKAMTRISGRQVNALEEPTIVSIGSLNAGNRRNILPTTAKLSGTIRTYSADRLADIQSQIEETVTGLATTYGASAEISYLGQTPATVNNVALVSRIVPGLRNAAGAPGVNTDATRRAAAEDFSFFAEEIPSAYYILGSTPNFTSYREAQGNHTPVFDIDEAVLKVGVKAHTHVVLTYFETAKEKGAQ